MFEICDAGSLCAVVGGRNEVIDCELVLLEEWVDVFLVEDFGALGLW